MKQTFTENKNSHFYVFLHWTVVHDPPPPRWQFSTQGADIGFGVFLKDKKGEWKKATQMQEVVPSQRYNAHLVPEDGSLTCERPGVCKWASTSSIIFIIHAKGYIENVLLCLFS